MKKYLSQIHTNVLKVSRLHFVYAFLMVLQLMLYDATKLQTPQVIMQRWIMSSFLVLTTTVIWYLVRTKLFKISSLQLATLALILVDILIAAYSVYSQRGMASRAVFLFLIPLLTSAALQTRAAIFGTLALCIATYSTTSVVYFVSHFNEGYKVELYGEVGFYCSMLTLVAMFVWNISRSKKLR